MSTDSIVIHSRFAPDGSVVEISERPKNLTPQEWFNLLNEKAPNAYQALAGGRVAFKLTTNALEAIKAEAGAA